MKISTFLVLLSTGLVYAGFTATTVDSSTDCCSFLFPADIDGDGLTDLAATAWDDSSVVLFRNLGGSWEKNTVCDQFYGATSVCVSDLNGDDIPDLAATAWEEAELRCWYGDGSGEYTEQVVASGLPAAHEVTACDVNDDGSMDLITAVAGLDRISVWLSDGSATPSWSEHVIADDMGGARSVCCADFDGNGTLDIAGAALSSGSVRWWSNSGDPVPVWTEQSLIESWNGAHMVRTGDLDQDGQPDIAAVAYYAGGVRTWLSSTGYQEFIPVPAFSRALGICIADFDGDGIDDIAATSENTATLKWWRNTGPSGTWTGETVDGALPGAWPVAASDLNGDGLSDLASAASFGTTVKWYENHGGTGIGTQPVTDDPAVFPNPSRGNFCIVCGSGFAGGATVSLFDLAGRKVMECILPGSSEGTMDLNASGLVSGVYSVRVTDGDVSETAELTILHN